MERQPSFYRIDDVREPIMRPRANPIRQVLVNVPNFPELGLDTGQMAIFYKAILIAFVVVVASSLLACNCGDQASTEFQQLQESCLKQFIDLNCTIDESKGNKQANWKSAYRGRKDIGECRKLELCLTEPDQYQETLSNEYWDDLVQAMKNFVGSAVTSTKWATSIAVCLIIYKAGFVR